MKIFGQVNTGRGWGYVAQVASQAAIFITVLNLFMLAATFYQTTLSLWLQDRGIVFPFWLFMSVLVAVLALMAVVLYKFAVPSFFNAFSEQFYKHDNPLRADIEVIKNRQNQIMERLGIEDSDSGRDTSRNN